jgi:hypothetical protein
MLRKYRSFETFTFFAFVLFLEPLTSNGYYIVAFFRGSRLATGLSTAMKIVYVNRSSFKA